MMDKLLLHRKKEFGDFQTPTDLATTAISVLTRLGIRPRGVIEPTCGQGAFVAAAAQGFAEAHTIIGNDINPDHIAYAKLRAGGDTRITLYCGDFFTTEWYKIIDPAMGPWLVLGNPPWVTNAELGALRSDNVPVKSNLHHHSGIDAITGKANFDISEFMLLQYLEWLKEDGGFIAVLCKTAVARKILLSAWKKNVPVQDAWIFKFDSQASFGISAAACLFVLALKPGSSNKSCTVFDSFAAKAPSRTICFDDGHLIGDANNFRRWQELLGPERTYIWRSGVKHDCSKVMELAPVPGGYRNGLGRVAALEEQYLYPLLKGSDIANGRLENRHVVLVTQRFVGEDTGAIRRSAPHTWTYLEQNSSLLDRRASAIYRGKPRFSVFGIGPYSFAPWKIAICGLYKRLSFVVVGPINNKPVLFDDTVYFLPAQSEGEAVFLASLLSSDPASAFFGSMIFWDEKRPITVDLLRRLDLRKLAAVLGREVEFLQFAEHPIQPHSPPSELPLWVQARGI